MNWEGAIDEYYVHATAHWTWDEYGHNRVIDLTSIDIFDDVGNLIEDEEALPNIYSRVCERIEEDWSITDQYNDNNEEMY